LLTFFSFLLRWFLSSLAVSSSVALPRSVFRPDSSQRMTAVFCSVHPVSDWFPPNRSQSQAGILTAVLCTACV